MSYGRFLELVIRLTLITLFVAGCSAAPAATPTAAPVATPAAAQAATPTPIPPTVSAQPPLRTPAPPAAQPTPTPQPTKPAAQQKAGELRHEKFTSQALAGNLIGDPVERGYLIYLPPGYADGTKRYPVVYILHGFAQDENGLDFLYEDYQAMLLKGTVQEMILVFANGNNKFGGSGFRSSPTIGDYETYLARELVAHIDATYRTIPQRDSRGITGCSMGGDGAMHLALIFPDVYGVTAPMSASLDWTPLPTDVDAIASVTQLPQDFNEYQPYLARLDDPRILIAVYIAQAAAAAPNPDKPPFYLDMPLEVVGGKLRFVPEVTAKIVADDEVHDVDKYLQQPVRLRHILLYYGTSDPNAEPGRAFDRLLTARGVDHQRIEAVGSHCDYDFTPVLQYLSDHLVGEQP
jgi:pimeloyl-ACP methyl ester carboxylesterase